MKRLLFTLTILLAVSCACFAQTIVQKDTQAAVLTDTAAVEVRTFSEASIKEFENDSDFQYDKIIEPEMNWWQKFWAWFWWKVAQVMSTKAGQTTVWSVLGVLGVAVIIFFVYKVMQMNKGGLFARAGGGGLDFSVGHEDIHEINFDEAIAAAIEKNNFRLAIRLLYLQSLKILSDRQIIDWKINKTNSDYVREVRERPWQPKFSNLTYQFEYVWYGETEIEKDKFDYLHGEFKQLHKLV